MTFKAIWSNWTIATRKNRLRSSKSGHGQIEVTRRDRVNSNIHFRIDKLSSVGSVKVKVTRRDKVTCTRGDPYQGECYQERQGDFQKTLKERHYWQWPVTIWGLQKRQGISMGENSDSIDRAKSTWMEKSEFHHKWRLAKWDMQEAIGRVLSRVTEWVQSCQDWLGGFYR